jgi:nucleoside phosphorylase
MLPTLLVPRGAEYQAVCRGLRGAAAPHQKPISLPVGPEPVAAFLQKWCQADALTSLSGGAVLVMGLCGSLRADLGVGTPVIYRACLDGRLTMNVPRLSCDASLTTSLGEELAVTEVVALTCDRIIHLATDKQALATIYSADVVDMEGFTALETLQKHNISVAMLRVVSDDLDHDLPNLADTVSPEGKLQPLPMLVSMVRQPVGAVRLIRGSLKGLQVLEKLTRTLAKAAAASEP